MGDVGTVHQGGGAVNLDNYVDVATRLRMALEKWPDLRIQERGHHIELHGEKPVMICEVAVYRTIDDPMPSIASAMEPIPGKTPFTRDSELMVGMTSALGRALGYMGIGLTGSIASRNEVENRSQAPGDIPKPEGRPDTLQGPTDAQKRMIRALGHAGPLPSTKAAASNLIDHLKTAKAPTIEDAAPEEDPF